MYEIQNEDGSIKGCISVDECDLRMVYSCLAYLDLLGLLDEATVEFKVIE